jgi:hypothetical protein
MAEKHRVDRVYVLPIRLVMRLRGKPTDERSGAYLAITSTLSSIRKVRRRNGGRTYRGYDLRSCLKLNHAIRRIANPYDRQRRLSTESRCVSVASCALTTTRDQRHPRCRGRAGARRLP